MKEFQTFISHTPRCRVVDPDGVSIVFKDHETAIPLDDKAKIAFLDGEPTICKRGKIVTEEDLNPVLALKKRLREEIIEEMKTETPLEKALNKQKEAK